MKKLKINAIVCVMLFLATILLSIAVEKTDAVIAVSSGGKKALPIYSVETSEKLVSISFDCAWGVEHTDKLLSEMEKFGVKCTFFPVQFWTEKYPDYVKKIDEAGHELGTHSATHSHMSKMNEKEIIAELRSSANAVEKITEKPVKLFRAPFGEYNDRLINTARNNGFEVIQWDVDSLDWKDLPANEIAMRIISKVQKGSIILCHNNGKWTADALALIFADLQAKGYKFVPIGELVKQGNYYIDNNGRQFAET